MMTVQDMRPETAALLRQIFSGVDVGWPKEGGLTPEIFFRETCAQGLAPLLFRYLKGKTSWPSALLSSFREFSLRQAAVELILEVDLRSLLNALAEIGVVPLLLKGTALAYTLYPEPWLRPRCDTDLLIPEGDREKTADLLRQLGCKPLHEANADWINAQMSWSRQRQGVNCHYDIHWRVSNNSRAFSRKFTENGLIATAIPALGRHAQTLRRTDALLLSCFHRAGHFSHSGDRLIWLYDIHLLCQSLSSTEAEAFQCKAKELEIIFLCIDAIETAQHWFNTTLPEILTAMLRERDDNEAFSGFLQPGRIAGIRNHVFQELCSMKKFRERLHFLCCNLFPPSEYMFWRYGNKRKYALPLLYAKRITEATAILFDRHKR